jgi:hypothetical protein
MTPGQRSLLFQEVNDRIYDLLESADPALSGEFMCECGRDCGRRVSLLPTAFATLREEGGMVRSEGCRAPRFWRRGDRSHVAAGVPVLS